MTTMNEERAGFEHCWAVRSADDEGNLGAKPLRSQADPQNYRGSAVQGSWVWFQRGAAWQRAQGAVPQASAAQSAANDSHDFKNFHRLLCERFGYAHDEKDWLRDQLSLIEWIAKQSAGVPGTPGASWRANGEPDPHGDRYNCERAALAMGDLTDDELANGAFMNYDRPLNIEGILAGTHSSPIAWMTAVKDRIRWLSRKLDEALAAAPSTPAAQGAVPDVSAMEAQSAPAGAGRDGLPLVIAGAIFDFSGFLTTREGVIEVGATANASPVADLIKEWAKLRGLSLADAAVLSWQDLLAAQQRTQAAAVPDVSAMAKVLSDRSADACNIGRDDNWAMYGQEYIEDVRAMLAAGSTGQEV